MSEEIYLIDSLKSLIKTATFDAKIGHKVLFKDTNNKINELSALAYFQKGFSTLQCAKSIYINNIDVLERLEIDEIFTRYEIMFDEVLSNITTDHSHQWSDIEYQNLKDLVDSFI